MTQRKRRIALTAALIAVLMLAGWTWIPATNPKRFYATLERHSWLTQVVRVGFLLAGRLDEFDQGIAQAQVDRMVLQIHLMDILEPITEQVADTDVQAPEEAM